MMKLRESGEMYLETIHILTLKKANVRAIDLASYMGYSKPSVSRALNILKSGGYLTVNENGFLVLTDKGKGVAEKTYAKHMTLEKILLLFGVSEETASKDACRIEHVISDETFDAIKDFVAKQ